MILADLKYNNYENKSIFVDVPRSSIVLYPKTEEEYNTLKETIQSQLGEASKLYFQSTLRLPLLYSYVMI